jgi:F-type H+-transporting ATPase subunit delta
MKDRKLAVRYARALLSVMTDPDRAESADRFLGSLAQAMTESAEFRDLMLDPAVALEDRASVLRSLAEAKGQPTEMANFLTTLVDHSRSAALPSIAAVFHEERERMRGIVAAEITTAEPMEPGLVARATQAIEKLTGREVRLTCHVEPELIGGAVTRIGSQVYDGSLKTQLNQLKTQLAQE